MTNEQAIDLLDNLIGFIEDNQNNDYDTALKMAIEALKETDMGLNNGDHLHPFSEPFGWTEEEIQKHGLRELLKDMPYAEPEKSTTAEKSQLAEEKSTCDLISRQDVINLIKAWGYSGEMREEINALPSAQPDLSGYSDRLWERACNCGYAWCKYDAVEAIEMLLEQSEDDEHDKTWNDAIRGSINAIKHHVPSAQTEIIACGDCTHYIHHDRRCGYWNHGVKPLEWCCHAERRADE